MFDRLPGFRDFYPGECAVRNHVFSNWRLSARCFGFSEYDAPVLESLDLFRAKSGDEIVEQLFWFTDRGGREVALRPEMTPSLARMAGARAASLKKPVKWYNISEQFRYERQQRGRLRSFYQFNADILGEPGPEAEIELIALLAHALTRFGLGEKDVVIRLSDRDLWFYFLRGLGLDEAACGGVLSVVDKMGREPEARTREKLETWVGDAAGAFLEKISHLRGLGTLEDVRAFIFDHVADEDVRTGVNARLQQWQTLLAGLKSMGLAEFVQVDLGVVRGLAYYTGFVFEAFDREGAFRALAGGGRYDHLIEKLGGPSMPAVGFAVGDVTLHELLELKKLLPSFVEAPDLYAVIGGSAERKVALGDVQRLREAGYRVDYGFRDVSINKQFKLAGASGARMALVYGSEELEREHVKVRDLVRREEETVPLGRLLSYLRGKW